MPVARDHFLR